MKYKFLSALSAFLLISNISSADQNTAPVAVVGEEMTALVGDTIKLDGDASFDNEGDALSYYWTLELAPEESTAEIEDRQDAKTRFVADKTGKYLASLVVNDGKLDSTKSYITFLVMSHVDIISHNLFLVKTFLDNFDENTFLPNTYVDFNNQVIKSIIALDLGNFAEANTRITNLILKTNGCDYSGHPDSDDVIFECTVQELMLAPLKRALDTLHALDPSLITAK